MLDWRSMKYHNVWCHSEHGAKGAWRLCVVYLVFHICCCFKTLQDGLLVREGVALEKRKDGFDTGKGYTCDFAKSFMLPGFENSRKTMGSSNIS